MSFISAYKRLREFARTGVWQIKLADLPRSKALYYRILRILLLAWRGFRQDKCPLRASALTFYSLLSVVPVAAMLFGVAKGFGFQGRLKTELLKNFPEHQEVVAKVVDFADSLLATTKGGLIAGVGILILFWTVVKVLGNIEQSFNDIWKIRQSRTIIRKFTDYLAIMLIGPINLIISSSATVIVAAQASELGEKLGLSEIVGPLVSILIWVLPWVLIWTLFAFIYIVMPNTKVKLTSGVMAAVIAGTVYQVTQVLFVQFQVGVAKYNAIYGSFAALPLFLVWLQLSWLIVLFGAEVSYAIQNVHSYEFAPLLRTLSPGRRRLLQLYIAHLGVKTFAEGKDPLTAPHIADRLGIPDVIVRDSLSELVAARLFTQTFSDEVKEAAYQPASDISRFTIAYVLEHLDDSGSDELPVTPSDELDAISDVLGEFRTTLQSSTSNRLLDDL